MAAIKEKWLQLRKKLLQLRKSGAAIKKGIKEKSGNSLAATKHIKLCLDKTKLQLGNLFCCKWTSVEGAVKKIKKHMLQFKEIIQSLVKKTSSVKFSQATKA